VAYLVRCALASGDTLVKQDQNFQWYTFPGALGLCQAWKYGGIHGNTQANRTCENILSACLMAHTNTDGVHVPIWLDSEASQIGWGTSPSYPYQEGTYFGNIMETGDLTGQGMAGVVGPVAYFCEGYSFNDKLVAGRLGSSSTTPYTNAFGTSPYGHSCDANLNKSYVTMTAHWSNGTNNPDGSHKPADGYQAIAPYTGNYSHPYTWQSGEPITVWRTTTVTNPAFDPIYDYGAEQPAQAGRQDADSRDGAQRRPEVQGHPGRRRQQLQHQVQGRHALLRRRRVAGGGRQRHPRVLRHPCRDQLAELGHDLDDDPELEREEGRLPAQEPGRGYLPVAGQQQLGRRPDDAPELRQHEARPDVQPVALVSET
jgi:hypothetical protein